MSEAEPSRRRTVLLLVLLLVTAGAFALKSIVERTRGELDELLRRSQFQGLEARRQALWSQARYDETGFRRMDPPRAGEWLDRFPEPGQTFEEYRSACANRRRPGREAIAIRPFGPLGPRARAAAEPIRRFCEVFFCVPARLLDETSLPDAAFAKERNQYDTGALLATLKAEVQEGELIRAGLLDRDLYWKGVLPNFVFGGATLSERTGVYSLHRFGAGLIPEPLYRHRAFKLLAHELGHILSLTHCVYYRCVMNGANSLQETDGAPCHVCPVCHEKLQWNLGFDARARDAALADVFRSEQIDEETRFHEARLARAGTAAVASPTPPR